MVRLVKRVMLCGCIVLAVWFGALIRDKQILGRELIRLHVVANSDDEADQHIKLRVRDVLVASLQEELAGVTDPEEAKRYLQNNLPKLESIANSVLREAGVEPDAVVTLCREAFGIREYNDFSLPSGIYESLRIVIGEGKGQNWWCVVYPQLCSELCGFEESAEACGMGTVLKDTLSLKPNKQIRFFLLDVLGEVENILFTG